MRATSRDESVAIWITSPKILRTGSASPARQSITSLVFSTSTISSPTCVPHQIGGGAFDKDLPVVHDDEPVAEPGCFIEVVRSQDDGVSLCLEGFEFLPDQVPGLRVETDGRFIEDRRSGLLTSARARISRRFIPPESFSTVTSRFSGSWTKSSSSSARLWPASCGMSKYRHT